MLSDQNFFDDAALILRSQFLLQAVLFVNQPLIVQPQLVQHRSVPVGDTHWIFRGGEAEVIGRPVGQTRLYTRSRHPDGKRARIVVAPCILRIADNLRDRHPAEFPHPR